MQSRYPVDKSMLSLISMPRVSSSRIHCLLPMMIGLICFGIIASSSPAAAQIVDGSAGPVRIGDSPTDADASRDRLMDYGKESVFAIFDYEDATDETLVLNVRLAGGVSVFSAQQVLRGSGTGVIEITGIGMLRSAAAGVEQDLRSTRSVADLVSRARLGHRDYLLQISANLEDLDARLKLLSGLDFGTDYAVNRAKIADGLFKIGKRTDEALRIDPTDVEAIQDKAKQIVAAIAEIVPVAIEINAFAQSQNAAPIPATEPRPGQPYDVMIEVDGFPAATAEFRISAPREPAIIYLPFSEQPRPRP